jgi:hypothetical protein
MRRNSRDMTLRIGYRRRLYAQMRSDKGREDIICFVPSGCPLSSITPYPSVIVEKLTMNVLRCSRGFSRAWKHSQSRTALSIRDRLSPSICLPRGRRSFHAALALEGIRSQVLKDVGEGMNHTRVFVLYTGC